MIGRQSRSSDSAILLCCGAGLDISNNEVEQMTIMAENCSKPLYFAVTSDKALTRALEIYEARKNIMIVFCMGIIPLYVGRHRIRSLLLADVRGILQQALMSLP